MRGAAALALVLAVATARADEVPCTRPHLHYAWPGGHARSADDHKQLEAIARQLRRDGYAAHVNGTSNKTCSDGEHDMPCRPDTFWLQLAVTDAQLAKLAAVRDPHVETAGDYGSHRVDLANAPYRALRPLGSMTIHTACEKP